MAKKPSLKTALKRVQKLERKRSCVNPKSVETKKSKEAKKEMVVRHRWSNGLETVYPILHPDSDDEQEPVEQVPSQCLIVGDGDFSFSCALLRQLGPSFAPRLISTVYDSQAKVQEKYSQAAGNIMLLQDAGVRVRFEIDGRELDRMFAGLPLTRIIFNYPHTGAGIKDRDRNIRAQQELLLAFLQSCRRLLQRSERGGIITRRAIVKQAHHSLQNKPSLDSEGEADHLRSQLEEEAEVHVTLRLGDPYDDWQLKRLGVEAGLHFRESFAFDPRLYPGYHHCRTIGDNITEGEEEDFLKRPAKTFVFTLPLPPPLPIDIIY